MCSSSLHQIQAAWQNVKILYWAIFYFFRCCICKKQVHTSPRKLSRARTVFKVPTCCLWGKINVEQARGRNAFKALLIELDGLQSQKLSVSTRLRLVSSWDVPHTYTSLNRLLWLTAPQRWQTLQRQWELYGKVVWKALPPLQNESPLAVNEGEVLPCWGPLGRPLNTGTFLSNSVWPEPNMAAEGHRIQCTTYREETKREGGKVGKIGCRGVRGTVMNKSLSCGCKSTLAWSAAGVFLILLIALLVRFFSMLPFWVTIMPLIMPIGTTTGIQHVPAHDTLSVVIDELFTSISLERICSGITQLTTACRASSTSAKFCYYK